MDIICLFQPGESSDGFPGTPLGALIRNIPEARRPHRGPWLSRWPHWEEGQDSFEDEDEIISEGALQDLRRLYPMRIVPTKRTMGNRPILVERYFKPLASPADADYGKKKGRGDQKRHQLHAQWWQAQFNQERQRAPARPDFRAADDDNLRGYRFSEDHRPVISPWVFPYVAPRPQTLSPIPWVAIYDDLSGRFFYFHPVLGARWDLPPGERYRVQF